VITESKSVVGKFKQPVKYEFTSSHKTFVVFTSNKYIHDSQGENAWW